VAKRLLEEFQGVLQLEGYAGFDAVGNHPRVANMGYAAQAHGSTPVKRGPWSARAETLNGL